MAYFDSISKVFMKRTEPTKLSLFLLDSPGGYRLSSIFLAFLFGLGLALGLAPGLAPTALAEPFGGAPAPPPVMVPTDVTNLPLIGGLPMGSAYAPALEVTSAVLRLPDSSFPRIADANDEGGGIIVVPKKDADYQRTGATTVQLTNGTIFVSVRKPSTLALIYTPQGMVAIARDGDSQITFEEGVLRVMNLSATGTRVKVQIHHAAVSARIMSAPPKKIDPGLVASADRTTAASAATANSDTSARAKLSSASAQIKISPNDADRFGWPVTGKLVDNGGPDGVIGERAAPSQSQAFTEGFCMALKIGHELVASDRTLNRLDLAPHDGIARRRAAVFENDHMAVSEFSLASALTQGDFLSTLNQNNPSPAERKVLGQLAKMAAVLDYVNGSGGFVASGKPH